MCLMLLFKLKTHMQTQLCAARFRDFTPEREHWCSTGPIMSKADAVIEASHRSYIQFLKQGLPRCLCFVWQFSCWICSNSSVSEDCDPALLLKRAADTSSVYSRGNLVMFISHDRIPAASSRFVCENDINKPVCLLPWLSAVSNGLLY